MPPLPENQTAPAVPPSKAPPPENLPGQHHTWRYIGVLVVLGVVAALVAWWANLFPTISAQHADVILADQKTGTLGLYRVTVPPGSSELLFSDLEGALVVDSARSPDGSTIAVVLASPDYSGSELRIIDGSGNGTTLVKDDAMRQSVSWRADGNAVVSAELSRKDYETARAENMVPPPEAFSVIERDLNTGAVTTWGRGTEPFFIPAADGSSPSVAAVTSRGLAYLTLKGPLMFWPFTSGVEGTIGVKVSISSDASHLLITFPTTKGAEMTLVGIVSWNPFITGVQTIRTADFTASTVAGDGAVASVTKNVSGVYGISLSSSTGEMWYSLGDGMTVIAITDLR